MKKVAIPILSLLLALYAAPANAVIVTAASGETGCNQNVGNAINVSAYRISNGDCVVEFRNVGTTTWTVPTGVTTISYLVVAGGGGGAGGQASEHGGGGGGAGGVVTGSTTVSTGNLSIVVGGGGNGGVANAVGTSGGDSMLAGLVTAFGGGRGGTYFTNAATVGGSGGGAGSGENRTGANGSTGQGNKGGNVTSSLTYGRHGGGGGGASAAGGNTTSSGGYTITAGAGGNGLASSITGTSTTYGGGGGGGGSSGGGGGSGATGGGSGGTGGGGSGATYNGTSLTSAATAGASNTGGGGGGGIGTGGSTASTGAAGGSGIIVVRYQPGPVNSNAPTITGTPQYGETLTANIGSWLYSPLSYTFQWMRSSTAGGSYTNISGATSSTYIPTATDINQYLKVAVTAANVNGSSSSNAQATAQVTKGATNQTLTIAPGDLIYRTSTSLTATVSTGGKLTFRANRESIPGCKNLVVSPANSYTRSCTYKPSRHGFVVITVIFTPTDPNFDAAISSSGSFFVKKRTGIR